MDRDYRRGYNDLSNQGGNMDNFGSRSQGGRTNEDYGYGRNHDKDTRTNFGFGSQNFSNFNDSERSGPRNYEPGNYGSEKYGQAQGLFSGKGPKGYKRSDARIHEDVCDALTHDSFVDASDIDIKVESAIVTLTGTVEDRRMKRKAEECVENCRGVEDVQNNLKVRDANLWEKVTGQEAKEPKTKTSTAGRLQ